MDWSIWGPIIGGIIVALIGASITRSTFRQKVELDKELAIQATAERYREQLLNDHREARDRADSERDRALDLVDKNEARVDELEKENAELRLQVADMQRLLAELRPTRRTPK